MNRMTPGLILCGLLLPSVALMADRSGRSEAWLIAEGGRLYDNWAKVVNFDAKQLSTHPAYPATGKQKGASTWRCKECHGWDYRGKDGAYREGSHYTGIAGIRAAAGRSPAEIERFLRASPHGYSDRLIPNESLSSLALFVSRGQLEMDRYIDRASKTARGDAARGAGIYQNLCATCHGFDGKLINFKDAKNPEYVGTVARKNPWEALHKIRNGQPGAPMVALGILATQDQMDVLAYTQTLPER